MPTADDLHCINLDSIIVDYHWQCVHVTLSLETASQCVFVARLYNARSRADCLAARAVPISLDRPGVACSHKFKGSSLQSTDWGGVRLPMQAEAGGTSHRHQVSGPRGCHVLLPHFPRCSLVPYTELVPPWRAVRQQVIERGCVLLQRQGEAGGTSHRHPVSCPRGCRALRPHFPRCSLGAFCLTGVDMASG